MDSDFDDDFNIELYKDPENIDIPKSIRRIRDYFFKELKIEEYYLEVIPMDYAIYSIKQKKLK